ncbi:MAG: hypothetical protein DI498_03360 [Paracoccus denitrificans]|nr:MAG: hypothetical protein DI498_03360 [Paracoccus denitrificans]PZO85566.1 MAG: hypothetical protein DI633_03360 [Paracoccus denitrificans]
MTPALLSRPDPAPDAKQRSANGVERANLGHQNLTRAQAQARNLICAERHIIRLKFGETIALVQVAGPQPTNEAWAWLAADLNGAPFAAALRWATARKLTQVALESATSDDAALLIEDGLTDVLDQLEDVMAGAIRLHAFGPTEGARINDAISVTLRVMIPDEDGTPARKFIVPLRMSPDATRMFAAALGPWSRPRSADLPLRLRVRAEIAAATLDLVDLRSLAPGDAVLMGRAGDAAQIVIENQFVAPAEPGQRPGEWRLTAPFRPATPPAGPPDVPTTGSHMTDPSQSDPKPVPADGQTQSQAPRAPLDDLDALQVTLSVRFGETTVPLADLRRAGPGAVFVLDRPDSSVVELVVNGQIVGTGELVSVAGQRAVEIKTLFGEG